MFDGFTRDASCPGAFALAKNPANWKLPIDAVVPVTADREVISSAVVASTPAACPKFIKVPGGVRVLAAG